MKIGPVDVDIIGLTVVKINFFKHKKETGAEHEMNKTVSVDNHGAHYH